MNFFSRLGCVCVCQVMGFEVDSINSVQFSNHTGRLTQTFCLFLDNSLSQWNKAIQKHF